MTFPHRRGYAEAKEATVLRNLRTRTVAKLVLRLQGQRIQLSVAPLQLAHPPRRWRWFAGRK